MPILVGLDLGQAQDYTAVAIIQQHLPPEQEPPLTLLPHQVAVGPKPQPPKVQPPVLATYHLRHIERLPLGLSYTDVVRYVKGLVHPAVLGPNAQLVVDGTGVGRAVVDGLTGAGVKPVRISITGGTNAHFEDGYWRVPKRDLVGVLQVLLGTQRLKFADDLPMLELLKSELQNFQVKITANAHDTYNAREGQHDDLVLATAVALWYGERTTAKPRPKARMHAGRLA